MPKNASKEEGIRGLQKAAILLISLGPERSAGIFKHLKEDEIEELIRNGMQGVKFPKRDPSGKGRRNQRVL